MPPVSGKPQPFLFIMKGRLFKMDYPTAGYAKAAITPPCGTLLSGYACIRRALNIHDNLFARVIAIKADEIFIIVQLDLLMVNDKFIAALCGLLEKKYCVSSKNVFVSCIHTHSGPMDEMAGGGYFDMSVSDGPIAQGILKQIVLCTGQALSNLCGFSLSAAKSHLSGIGLNRRDPSAPIDDGLFVLSFDRSDGKKIVVYNYACHPTIMNAKNKSVTADYPGQAAKILESQESVACALFLNGACGDVSTRFTRKESSFSEVARIGSILGGEVLKLLNSENHQFPLTEIKSASASIEAKIKALPSLNEAKTALSKALEKKEKAEKSNMEKGRLRLVQSAYEGALMNLEAVKNIGSKKSVSFQIKALKIDDIFFVYIPGELFTPLALKLKRNFKGTDVNVVCYGNGNYSYIPDRKSYEEGGYETMTALFAPGEGERIIGAAVSLIKLMLDK